MLMFRFAVLLVPFRIFLRNVIFRHFSGMHFAFIGIRSILHAADRFGFHVLPFFHQLFHALRILVLPARESLGVTGLSA